MHDVTKDNDKDQMKKETVQSLREGPLGFHVHSRSRALQEPPPQVHLPETPQIQFLDFAK